MRNKILIVMVSLASVVYADAYRTLVQRYESQIKKQESQLRSLRRNLIEKEQEAKRWQRKAESARAQWTEAGLAVEQARKMVRQHQERRTKTRVQAEAVQWSVLEHSSLGKAADQEISFWVTEMYKRYQTPRLFKRDVAIETDHVEVLALSASSMVESLGALSQATHLMAEKDQEKETALRLEEFRWQNEEQKQMLALDHYRQQQQGVWLKWQEAIQKRKTLEEERAQMEQSAQALRVMLTELREHRDQTVSSRVGTSRTSPAVAALKGTLPWPAPGEVTQNFGRQYSDKLQQLIVSNGIRVETEAGRSVRTIQPGKVLFARPFQQYGQLVIVRHHHGLTSVYGELGQTQVKEGDILASLDAIGTVGEGRSFYFELRQDEQPINPLAWLAPRSVSDVSTRRKFQ